MVEIDLEKINTYSLKDRDSLVRQSDFATPWSKGGLFSGFLDSLSDILAAKDIKRVINAIVTARKNDNPVIFGMGAHVLKVGLSPVVIDLMKRGVVTAVAMNGAGIIHDFEIAFAGQTSEDVAQSLSTGSFGMAKETGEYLSNAIHASRLYNLGLGKAVGQAVMKNSLPYKDVSVFAAAATLNIPATVHLAVGTDIIHMHPDFDPAAAAAASHKDFKTFAGIVAELEGGVYVNIGSAVILPEIFLKALTLARNLGYTPNVFTTVNLDFIRQYRPMTNVVNRPNLTGGKGYHLTGHHEIMLPLIAAGVIEAMG